MSKLNKEELLRELREVFDHYLKDLRDYPSEVIVKQACQQIKEMIQKPQVTEETVKEKLKNMKGVPRGREERGEPYFDIISFDVKGLVRFIRSLVGEITVSHK